MDSPLHALRIERHLKHSHRTGGSRLPWVLVILLLLGGGVYAGVVLLGGAAPVAVEVLRVPMPAAGAGGGVTLNATGYIVAAHRVSLAPKVVGRVAWIGVEMADKVEKGQELVRLEDDEYRARLLQAQGQLEAAKARLAELENGSRPEEVAIARAELDRARVELDRRAAQLRRVQGLVSSGAVADQDLDDAEAAFKAQEALVASLQRSLELSLAGPRREQIEAQRAVVKQAQGILDAARVDMDNTIIRAPLSGTILERNVEVGEYVTTGFVGDRGAKGYVVALADLNDLHVELDISQNDFARTSPNQRCRVTTDAYPDRKYEGVVYLVAPQANRQKATILVKIKVLNPDAFLRPDMNASVAFLAPEAPGGPATQAAAGIVIPASALRDGAVFLVAGGKAQRRLVEAGPATAAGVPIRRGLAGGEELIVNPPAGLADGQAVRIQESRP